MDWWQKLTIDWPCALGDWLWAMLVVPTVEFLNRLTRRRVLHFLGILLLLLVFQYVVAFDLFFLFGVDLGLLMEVSAAVMVLAARQGAQTLTYAAWQQAKLIVERVIQTCRRGSRAVRTHAARMLLPPKSDEDGEGHCAFA